MPRNQLRTVPPVGVPFRLNQASWQSKGLVLWVPFIGSGGTTRGKDLARYNLDAVFPGGSDNPTWQATPVMGEAISLSGGDYVTCTDGYTNTIKSDNNHTISLWFYPRDFTNLPMLLDSPGLGDLGCFIEVDASNVYWGYNGALGYRQYAATPVLNAWNHVLVVKRATGDNGDLYLNGVKETSWTRELSDPPNGTSDFVLGKYQTAGFEFDGMLSDFRVYDYGMSDAEAFQIWAPQTRWELYSPARSIYARQIQRFGGVEHKPYFMGAWGGWASRQGRILK